jgi:hypothetical protein
VSDDPMAPAETLGDALQRIFADACLAGMADSPIEILSAIGVIIGLVLESIEDPAMRVCVANQFVNNLPRVIAAAR